MKSNIHYFHGFKQLHPRIYQLMLGGVFHRTIFLLIATLAVISHFKAMTTDPGAVPPDANPLPEEEDLDWVVKGEQLQQHHGEYHPGPIQSHGQLHTSQPQAFLQEDTSSLLAGEEHYNDKEGLDATINTSSPKNVNEYMHKRQEQPSVSDQALSGMAVAAVAPVALVGAGVVAMTKVPTGNSAENEHRNHQVQHQQQQTTRGRRMCRRCKAFKPPRAHHCRSVSAELLWENTQCDVFIWCYTDFIFLR